MLSYFFQEKLKGRNKLVPRLFGVSKESVMRVDEKTKEIIETWSLTRIRRWAATANLFTLVCINLFISKRNY